MIPELSAIAVVILAGIAEVLHLGRVKRLSALAFGPTKRPAAWAHIAPVLRPVAAG